VFTHKVKEELTEKRVTSVITIFGSICAVNLGENKGDLTRKEEQIDGDTVDPDY
jgi:hypothetical protein